MLPSLPVRITNLDAICPNENPNWEVSERTPRDHTTIDIEDSITEKEKSELFKILGRVLFLHCVFFVIVLPIHYYFLVPDIQNVPVGQIELAVPSEYTLEMYQGRLPWALLNYYCCGRNAGENFGTFNIETQYEDMIIDSVIRSNIHNIFRNLKPNQRVMWTGGFTIFEKVTIFYGSNAASSIGHRRPTENIPEKNRRRQPPKRNHGQFSSTCPHSGRVTKSRKILCAKESLLTHWFTGRVFCNNTRERYSTYVKVGISMENHDGSTIHLATQR